MVSFSHLSEETIEPVLKKVYIVSFRDHVGIDTRLIEFSFVFLTLITRLRFVLVCFFVCLGLSRLLFLSTKWKLEKG